MRKKASIFKLATFLMLPLSVLLVSSCDDGETSAYASTSIHTHEGFKYEITYDKYASWGLYPIGEKIMMALRSAEESEVSIKEVGFYIDDVMISQVQTAPFSIEYALQSIPLGKHFLEMKVKLGYEDGCESEVSLVYNFHVVAEEPKIINPVVFDEGSYTEKINEGMEYKTTNDRIWAGKIGPSTVSTIDFEIKKVEYYWDGKIFAASSIAPYSFSLDLRNETKGKHEFKVNFYLSTEYGDKEYRTIFPVEVE